MQKNGQSATSTTGPKLWVILARAHGALASYVQDRIAAEGLGLSDFMVLEVLLHKGPMSISAIGEKVLLANASMTAAVDRLEEKGWVVRQSSESDRRSKVVTLTREGRAFISSVYARHARDIEAVTSALSPQSIFLMNRSCCSGSSFSDISVPGSFVGCSLAGTFRSPGNGLSSNRNVCQTGRADGEVAFDAPAFTGKRPIALFFGQLPFTVHPAPA